MEVLFTNFPGRGVRNVKKARQIKNTFQRQHGLALLGAVMTVLVLAGIPADAQLTIIPQPMQVEAGEGYFLLNDRAVIGVNKETERTGRYLQAYLQHYYGLTTTVTVFEHIPVKVPIQLNYNPGSRVSGYSLQVGPRTVTISGDGAGVFYGVQTLLETLPTDGRRPVRVLSYHIADEPRFQWRGLSLDVSRHFFTVDEVKKYIDVMAHYKLNVLHWHLTDDEGWRIQIDKYPKLTEIGSRISYYAKSGAFRKLDNLNDEGRDGYYTKEEIKEVINYASERFITILPEIEMPGHSEAAIFAYPLLGCQDSTGDKHRVRMLDPSEYTFGFMEDVLTEVIALFPNQYIHIGGDEAEMVDWLKSPTAVSLMKREHLESEKQVQSYFIKRIEKFLLLKHKRLVGWDEILAGGLAESATVMSWQGESGGISAARMHHHVVMTPLPFMYFDAPQGNEELEPKGWNPPVPWQMVYDYEPQSKELDTTEARYILGAQGNIWTEKISTMKHLEYMVYPRALAVAELTWSAKKEKDADRFYRKMTNQYGLFKLWNFNARLPEIEGIENVVTNKNRYRARLTYPLQGATVRYNLDGRMPDSSQAALPLPVDIDVPLKDSIGLRTFATWKMPGQHIFQMANVRRVEIRPSKGAVAGLKSGLAYRIYQSREEDMAKLDQTVPTAEGETTGSVPVPSAADGYLNWVRVEGYIRIEKEADYELTTGFEVSPALSLGDVPIMKRGLNRHVEPQKAVLHLAAGIYDFSGYYVADDSHEKQPLIALRVAGGGTVDPARYLLHRVGTHRDP